MKKYFPIFILVFVTLICLFTLSHKSFVTENYNSNKLAAKSATAYKDYSTLNSLPVDYSYSTIFLSKNTTFKVITNSGKVTESTVQGDGVKLPLITDIDPGDSVSLLITNCAVNKKGEMLDVVVTIDNVEKYDSDYNVFFVLNEEKLYLTDQTNPNSTTKELTGYGDAIPFLLMAQKAKCDFTLTYYKSGTYNASTKTGEYGGIDYINSFYYDIDTADWIGYSGKFLNADEGFSPTTGSSTIYYNKTNNDRLYETSNGLAAKTTSNDTDAIWYKNSAFMLTENVTNSTYKFTYGGTGCGMGYIFQSPYPYSMNEPTKTVSKAEATTGETIFYNISQYIPNNYYGDVINFNQVYSNFYSSTRLSTLEITDVIDSNLAFYEDSITITNELGENVTSDFTIATSGQTITATANTSNFSNQYFYNHVYTIKIPVTIKNINNLTSISNSTKTTYAFSGGNKTTLNSNSVSTKIYYNLIVNHYKIGEIIPVTQPIITKHYAGDKYTTSSIKIENYELVETPKNATGTITNTTNVNYYYQLKKGTITVHHYIKGTTTKLADDVVTTQDYTTKYSTSPASVDANYELVSPPSNASGTVSGNIEVTYYYQLKTATLTVNYYEEGTTNKLSNSIVKTMNWGEEYTTSSATDISKNYELVSTPTNSKGTIKGDVTVNYYYKLRDAKLTVNYYIEGTTDKLADSVIKDLKWGEKYTTTPSDKVSSNYELVGTPSNAAGTIGDNAVVVNYYYRLKKATITVHHYIKGTTTKLADDVVTTQDYTTTYKTSPASVDANYELVETPSNASGTVSGNIEVNYYYRLKEATLTVHHYIEGTKTSLVADEISTVYWGNSYTTNKSNNISSNYELASTKGTLSGTVTGNIEVTYYYKLKSSTLTVKHLEYGTNNVMAPEETKSLKYTDEYETSVSTSIPGNYEYYSKTDNYKGIVSLSKIEVIYYYQKKDSQLSTEIKLTVPEEITDKNEKVDYKIDYETTISDYKGEGVINITANLPYHIDESISELNGGTYNNDLKTITWTITEDEIDASTESKTLTITKEISVIFNDLNPTDRIVNTSVSSNIKLDNNERDNSDTAPTYIRISSKIIVHHYIEGTTDKIVDDIESTDLVGETYVSEPLIKDGYILKKEPDTKNHIYQDETTEVIYEYEKIKFNIITKVTGDGGIIQGDESVYYGENSTEDNIIIKPNEGYVVSKIIINGIEQEIKECKTGCVLNSFVEVRENKEVIVVFEKIPDNPQTLSIITKTNIIKLSILSIIVFILIKKFKPTIIKI